MRERWFRARRQWPIAAAAAIAAATFMVSGMARGTYPFGSRSRNAYDLGHQFIPMAAHLRDVVTGQANGDLLFNWQSGFGVPFFGDFMAYVGSSLSWIALVLPRARIDLALYLIAAAAIGLAAGAMTAYLRMLRPGGPAWIAATAGASYGACAWAIGDAAYMTLWLSGLVAFPVICLLCEWILRRRSIVATVITPLVVALLWTSHFYTVYMATIGAGIVTLARVLAGETADPWRWQLTGALRCMAAVALGIGLTAPLLAPTFEVVQASTPSTARVFRPIEPQLFLSRLLSGTEGLGTSPGLAVGTLMLLLALSFPFNRAITLRRRVVWTAAVALTVASLQVRFTHEVWHGFDTPDGNPFRQAFVAAGLLVIVGWLSVSAGLRSILTVAAPIVTVFALYVWTWDVRTVSRSTHVVVPALAGLAVLTWLVLRSKAPRLLRRSAVAILLGGVLMEATLSAVVIDVGRAKVRGTTPFWGAEHSEIRSLVEMVDDWPQHRTSPGGLMTDNDPMLLGGQGPEHYSSTIPYRTTQALLALGFGYSAYGRAVEDPKNPVVDAIFAVQGRVVREVAPRIVTTDDVAPLVTIRPARSFRSTDPGPYGIQETALGADVYTVPQLTAGKGSTARISGTDVLRIAPGIGTAGPSEAHLVAHCQPGAEVYLAAPEFVGDVLVDGWWKPILRSEAKRPGIYSGAPMIRAGSADAQGNVRLDLQIARSARLPATSVGCLDRARLKSAVANLTAPTAIDVRGHSLTARLTPGAPAVAVIGVIRIEGWSCTVDGAPTLLRPDVGGLLAVPVRAGASEVTCTYRPPGARLGMTAGAGSLTALLFLTALLAWRRRRNVQSPGLREQGW